MNQLVSIVGASGVGKTTLARALCKRHDFVVAYEGHDERPFQKLFKQDAKYALANQLDYLLYRAEQEYELRQSAKPILMDGGLDLDFHGFTRLFHARGFLNDAEFDLCRRFYEHTRKLLPPPELIVHLSADAEIICGRLASRNRINIASSEDAETLDGFVNHWLSQISESRILRLDVSNEDEAYLKSVSIILGRLAKQPNGGTL
ncbi:MAG: deoxynucleoside kinase [Anaerolineales bacterium]|nr:deoxynucleoside kinase [Anaerolineales bacterium]